jgi:hypothetical protein
MENMEGLWIFFLIIVPASILFILFTTRSAGDDDIDSANAKQE